MTGAPTKRQADVRKLDLIDTMTPPATTRSATRNGRARTLGLSDLRLVLGHVHRQLA